MTFLSYTPRPSPGLIAIAGGATCRHGGAAFGVPRHGQLVLLGARLVDGFWGEETCWKHRKSRWKVMKQGSNLDGSSWFLETAGFFHVTWFQVLILRIIPNRGVDVVAASDQTPRLGVCQTASSRCDTSGTRQAWPLGLISIVITMTMIISWYM